ncbi:MAG: hypothetical protein ACLTSZ_12495 [Lachnospiraceae bacterium]
MKKKKIAAVAVSSVLLFVAGIVLSLCLGSRTVAFTKVLEALSGKHVETLGAKVVLARVPRTIFEFWPEVRLASPALLCSLLRGIRWQIRVSLE